MTAQAPVYREHGNAYNIFILVLTIFSLVLMALLILPIVIVATREALRAIPQTVREGAYACGATKWQVCHDHLIPYGMPGILTGVIIGLSRAIGETAPIITIGALTFIAFLPPLPFTGVAAAGPFEWLFSPFTVLPSSVRRRILPSSWSGSCAGVMR